MPKVICTDDVAARPWRNGGGFARDLVSWPAGEGWRVRISVADIDADGPFSAYPEVERWFAVVEGAGVCLTVGGVEHRLGTGDAPLRFDGSAATSCRLLDGRTRDLNLMLRGTAGAIHRAVAGEAWRPRSARCALYAATAGRCTWGDRSIGVAPHTLLCFESMPEDEALHFSASDAWWIAIGGPIDRAAA